MVKNRALFQKKNHVSAHSRFLGRHSGVRWKGKCYRVRWDDVEMGKVVDFIRHYLEQLAAYSVLVTCSICYFCCIKIQFIIFDNFGRFCHRGPHMTLVPKSFGVNVT